MVLICMAKCILGHEQEVLLLPVTKKMASEENSVAKPDALDRGDRRGKSGC